MSSSPGFQTPLQSTQLCRLLQRHRNSNTTNAKATGALQAEDVWTHFLNLPRAALEPSKMCATRRNGGGAEGPAGPPVPNATPSPDRRGTGFSPQVDRGNFLTVVSGPTMNTYTAF